MESVAVARDDSSLTHVVPGGVSIWALGTTHVPNPHPHCNYLLQRLRRLCTALVPVPPSFICPEVADSSERVHSGAKGTFRRRLQFSSIVLYWSAFPPCVLYDLSDCSRSPVTQLLFREHAPPESGRHHVAPAAARRARGGGNWQQLCGTKLSAPIGKQLHQGTPCWRST